MKIASAGLVLPWLALCAHSSAAQTIKGTENTPVEVTGPSVPATAATTPATTETPARLPGSGVRIVRLSQVVGETEMDRNGRGYEEAFANLPIVQGAKLRTAKGVAEVELEDGSTMRLAPGSAVTFPELRRSPNGTTTTRVQVDKGTVYLSLAATKGNSFVVTRGETAVTPQPGSHIRLAADDSAGNRLSVLSGMAEVNHAGANMTVGKKTTLVFGAAGQQPQLVTTNADRTEVDEWDKNATEYHGRYNNAAAFGGASGYGVSDLNYYGSFADLPGCGNVWRPYFASAAWNPYSNGTWAFYQDAGYSWVSPYPWGWAPYHTGQWQSCGAAGWGWQPGGQFTGLANAPALLVRSGGGGSFAAPRAPGTPRPGQPTLIRVNATPLPISGQTKGESFVFRKDSAGLGVPRQTFGKLGGVSAGVARQGAVSTYIQPASAVGYTRAGSSPAIRSQAAQPTQAIGARGGVTGGPAIGSRTTQSSAPVQGGRIPRRRRAHGKRGWPALTAARSTGSGIQERGRIHGPALRWHTGAAAQSGEVFSNLVATCTEPSLE